MNNRNINNVIVNALDYYDKNYEKNEKIFLNAKYINFPLKNKDIKGDITRNTMTLYDKNKEEIFSSRYEYIGVYDSSIKTWTWAWSIPELSKKSSYISRKILNYGLDLESNNTHNTFLRAELITGRFRITNKIQLELHASIASYIAKIPKIYKYILKHSKNSDKYIEISDIDYNDNYSVFYLFLLD